MSITEATVAALSPERAVKSLENGASSLPLLAALVFFLTLSCISLRLFTLNNDFPTDFHPDERGKAQQLTSTPERRNFNHPLLMLEATDMLKSALNIPNNLRAVIRVGRFTSATMASLAVVALALAAFVKNGLSGAVITGACVCLCPPLLIHAHYFKEDTSLIAGMAVALLSGQMLIASSQWVTQLEALLILGLGVAAAISSKYIGICLVLPAVFAVLAAPTIRWWVPILRIMAFTLICSAIVILINYRGFNTLLPPRLSHDFREAIVREYLHGSSGHADIALNRPNIYCLRVAATEIMPHIWVFLIVGTVALLYVRQVTRRGIFFAILLATWIAVLCFNAIPFPRYALPITVCVYFIAGEMMSAALGRAAQSPRARAVACALILLVAVLLQGWQCLDFDRQFQDDSRIQLHDWIGKNLSASNEIVIDAYTGLRSSFDLEHYPEQKQVPPRIIDEHYAADAGDSVDELANRGVDYVAVAKPSYEIFFAPGVHASQDQASMARRQAFYRNLFKRGDLVWQYEPSNPTDSYTNPELRLYRIAHLKKEK